MKTKLAVAQTIPYKGNVDKNLESHLAIINKAIKNNADFIIFPELSLTGYELELAEELAFVPNDYRLDSVKKISIDGNIVVVAGAPIRLNSSLHIGLFILYPDGTEQIYTKRFPHGRENDFFKSGIDDPEIVINGLKIRLAICADLTHKEHAVTAFENKADIYASSVFITPAGYGKDTLLLKEYASKYKMCVMMSNYGGTSGGMESAGMSGYWNTAGNLIGNLDVANEAILVISVTKEDSGLEIVNESF